MTPSHSLQTETNTRGSHDAPEFMRNPRELEGITAFLSGMGNSVHFSESLRRPGEDPD
jgi:hypothetical protein